MTLLLLCAFASGCPGVTSWDVTGSNPFLVVADLFLHWNRTAGHQQFLKPHTNWAKNSNVQTDGNSAKQ
jgi:hypothetical protein